MLAKIVNTRMSQGRKHQLVFVVVGLIPIMAYFSVFSIYPVFSAFRISLHRWGLLQRERPFIGFDNYLWAINDPVFWASLRNTMFYVVFFVGLVLVFSLLAALFVNSLRAPFKELMRGVIFMPVVTSLVAVSLMFVWLYQPSFGVLNFILDWFGLGPFDYLQSSTQVLPSIIAMGVWKSVGYSMVIFLAGLTTIPQDFYEAAYVDGASPLRVLFSITLPLLKPTTVFVLVTSVISSVQVFTEIYIMTRGGPGTASRTLVLHIYETGFQFFQMGRASAVAFIMFAVILVLTLVQLRRFRIDFEY